MKLLSRIKAFFTFKGEVKEVNVKAAQVRPDGIFLHPADDPNQTFFIKSTAVDIVINPNGEVTEEDIFVIDKQEKKEKTRRLVNFQKTKNTGKPESESKKLVERSAKELINQNNAKASEEKPTAKKSNERNIPQEMKYDEREKLPLKNFFEPKKKLTLSLYVDEYEMITHHLKENGYKKNEYFLSCITASKKQSMDATYSRWTAARKRRRENEVKEAHRAREEEYNNRRNQQSKDVTETI